MAKKGKRKDVAEIAFSEMRERDLADVRMGAAYLSLSPGQQIKFYRLLKDLTQEELAALAGVGRDTIIRVEAGGNTSLATIASIKSVLFAGHGAPEHQHDADPAGEDVSGYEKNAVPVIAEGDASPQPNLFWADNGVLLSEVEDRISRPFDVRDPRAYGVRVRGDSMITRLRPGDVAIVSPNTPVRDGDEVYAQLLSGERLLKVAHKMSGGWLLESYNRAYEPRQVKKSEIGAMHPILWIRSLRRSK